jgi:hypothetical protein
MKDDLDGLKSSPSVIKIYERYTKLHKSGDQLLGKCPLHADNTPSFCVYPDMRWTCFATCGSGNIFQLIQKADGVDFKEAVNRVKDVVGDRQQIKDRVDRVFKPAVEEKTQTIPTLRYAAMEESLHNTPEALRFLYEQRGITKTTAKKLKLGFVRSIPSKEDRADIANKGWIVFPSIEGDEVVSLKYRSIVRKKPGGFARQAGMRTELFNARTVSPFDDVYVTEGEFDAAILEQHGFRSVSVPSAGAKLTPAQKDLLEQAKTVILAGDNDEAGGPYMEKLWRELAQAYRLRWPSGTKDANEAFLTLCGRNPEKFTELIRDLTRQAMSQPMPSVFSLQDVLLSGDRAVLADSPYRLHLPWPTGDKAAIIMPGEVFGIGSSNSGMGKSMLAVQLTLHNAMKYNHTIVNWQTEMKPEEIATMIAANVLRKDRNFLTRDDMKEAAKRLEGVRYYIGYDPTISDINGVLDLLDAAAKRLSADGVVLDHFHHLTTGMSNESQVQQAAMTRIVQIAKLNGAVFYNIGQPRKATQQTKGRQIHITDFKGSGAWGDAANAVLVIHRELNTEEGAKGVYKDKTLAKFLKTRTQGTGNTSWYMTCFGEFASFHELTEEPNVD